MNNYDNDSSDNSSVTQYNKNESTDLTINGMI